jgi:hypothetical protein
MFSLGKSLLTHTTSQFLDPSRGGYSHDLHRYRDVISGAGYLELRESGRVGECQWESGKRMWEEEEECGEGDCGDVAPFL